MKNKQAQNNVAIFVFGQIARIIFQFTIFFKETRTLELPLEA
jgi:hypothetical protein